MKLRRFVSLVLLWSFTLLLLTSIMLFVAPQGKVANWADWHLWGLSKVQWGNLHINLGWLFVIASIVHVVLNWGAIRSYIKAKAVQTKPGTRDVLVSILLTAAVGFGTYFEVPPFQWVINANEAIKEKAAKTYGDPPYGHAEISSVKVFTKKTGLDLKQSMQALNKAGFKVESPEETLLSIAQRNGVAPKALFEVMQTAVPPPALVPGGGFPASPPAGTGMMPLSKICTTYGVDVQVAIQALKDKGIEATPEMTMKEIGQKAGRSLMDIYEIIK
jgi:hypothetical protein